MLHQLSFTPWLPLLPPTLPLPANDDDKGVRDMTTVALAVGILLPIAIDRCCLPLPQQESMPPLATIPFS